MIEERIRDLSVLYLFYKMFFFPILKDRQIQSMHQLGGVCSKKQTSDANSTDQSTSKTRMELSAPVLGRFCSGLGFPDTTAPKRDAFFPVNSQTISPS